MAPRRSCLDRFCIVVSVYLHLVLCARCVALPLNDAAGSCKQPHNHTPPASFAVTATKVFRLNSLIWQKAVYDRSCLCWCGYVWFMIILHDCQIYIQKYEIDRRIQNNFNEKDSISSSYYGFILSRHWEIRGETVGWPAARGRADGALYSHNSF